MSTSDDMPVICAGTDAQPSCRHWRAGGCWHPENCALDLVRTGAIRPIHTADWMRQSGRCGEVAKLYEPRPCAALTAKPF